MRKSKTDDQTIVEHLTEFRKRFVAVAVCFILVFCLSLVYADSLYRFLTAGLDHPLLVLGPNDILAIYIRLATVMAFALTLPFLVYQIWAFIKPALKKGEAAWILAYVPASFICFVLGLLFGYFLVGPAILQVLLGLGEGLFDVQLTAENYLNFLLYTTVPIGVLFELPVIVAFLTSIGLISPQFLSHYRRYAYFILLVLAVVLTPADFVSDLAMTLPLILLYEISLIFSKIIYKGKNKRR